MSDVAASATERDSCPLSSQAPRAANPIEPSIFDAVKQAADGRCDEIIAALTPLTGRELVKGSKDHPCPVCGGKSRIWPAGNAKRTGRLACHECTGNKPTRSIIDTVQVFGGYPAAIDATKAIAEHLGLDVSNNRPARKKAPTFDELLQRICKEKRMPVEAFLQFEPTLAKRGKAHCIRVPVWNAKGEKHSHFDFFSGKNGFLKDGDGMAGLFFPGRLPQPGETWLIVEGCKDAAALVGLGFNAAGLNTSKMNPKYARLFADCHAIITPDLDSAGQNGARNTGGVLTGVAASVLVARLPGELKATSGDDVRDVIAKLGDDAVREAIANAKPWKPSGKPVVVLSDARSYGEVTEDVINHLAELGWDSPWIAEDRREFVKLYRRGGRLVEVLSGGDGTQIQRLPNDQVALRIDDACQLVADDDESSPKRPPVWLNKAVPTLGRYPGVRELSGIVTVPTLRPDGSILQEPGYDEASGLIYKPNAEFPRVPDEPTREDAQRAASELLEVIADFEFVDEADRSAWLAQVLTIIGRPAIPGCCPLFATTASTPGSGKSLTIDAAQLIALGRPAAREPYTSDDDEMRKRITSAALEGQAAVLLDNIARQLGGAALDAALTAETWTDRVLGRSETTGELSMRTVWMATGNNLRFGSDIARRVLPIRLTTSVENPEERSGFAHPNLLAWVRQNRPRLTIAALTILRAYHVAGRPEQQGGTFGSFQDWSDLVRGAIVWAGIPDPLATREAAKADDMSKAIVARLIGGLVEIDDANEGLTVREIIARLDNPSNADRFQTMRDVAAEVATERGRIDPKRLGYALRNHRGRIAGGLVLHAELNRTKTTVWAIRHAGDAGDAETDPLHPSPASSAPQNTGKASDAGDAGDLFNLNTNRCNTDRCNTHAHAHAYIEVGKRLPITCITCSRPHSPEIAGLNMQGMGAGVLAGDTCTYPTSPAPQRLSQPGPPCRECGSATTWGPLVEGWRNADCPVCGSVRPVRVAQEVAT